MQIESLSQFFNTVPLTTEHPVSPEGYLFTYHPEEDPAALHYHNFLELGYCEYGTGLFIVDGEVIPFNGKCVSIVYERQVHIAKSVSPEKSLWHFLYIDLDKLFSTSPELLHSLRHLTKDKGTLPTIIRFQEDPRLYNLVSDILEECAICQDNYLSVVRGMVCTLLTLHSRYLRKSDPFLHSVDSNDLLVELGSVLTYISNRYSQPLTIKELCSVAGMSKSTLQRKMISCIGYSPLQYIHHLRLNHAAVLLRDKSLPISEIANRSGFSTISSFNRSFLKAYGLPPSQWRKTLH